MKPPTRIAIGHIAAGIAALATLYALEVGIEMLRRGSAAGVGVGGIEASVAVAVMAVQVVLAANKAYARGLKGGLSGPSSGQA